jgi:hypothetical protein
MRDRRGRNIYRVLVGRPDGTRLFGRPRRRWKDNIKLYLEEIGWEGVDWFKCFGTGTRGGLL